MMNAEPLVCLKDPMSLDAAVGELLKLTENTGIARWVQFPRAVLLFLVVPNDPASGAFHVFDRRTHTWIWVDFEDQAYRGYTLADFDTLVRDCRFLPRNIHDFRNKEGLAMVQIRCLGRFETQNEAFLDRTYHNRVSPFPRYL
jgi:hypothetical protein